jgi:single-strand DNA-binding protein
MVSLNKVMIMGNLGKDPEMRYMADGTAMTKFSVAANRNYTTPDGERREETEWFNVVAWRKLAEQCSQFLQKGRRVYVEGRLQTRSWEDQERPGQKHYMTEVVAERVLFLDRAGAGGGDEREYGSREYGAPPESSPPDMTPEDIPFE